MEFPASVTVQDGLTEHRGDWTSEGDVFSAWVIRSQSGIENPKDDRFLLKGCIRTKYCLLCLGGLDLSCFPSAKKAQMKN